MSASGDRLALLTSMSLDNITADLADDIALSVTLHINTNNVEGDGRAERP